MRFYIFTKKALRRERGNPYAVVDSSRIFFADDSEDCKPDKNGHFAAWKMDVQYGTIESAVNNGTVGRTEIPLTAKDINRTTLRKAVENARKRNSEPTAYMRLDSYYREVSFEEVRAMLRKGAKEEAEYRRDIIRRDRRFKMSNQREEGEE